MEKNCDGRETMEQPTTNMEKNCNGREIMEQTTTDIEKNYKGRETKEQPTRNMEKNCNGRETMEQPTTDMEKNCNGSETMEQPTTNMEKNLSKILIIGGTGYIGKYMVKASVSLGHKTYAYARPITSQTSPSKIKIRKEFQSMGVTIVEGELDEHEKMVALLRQVDIVISTVAFPQILDQFKIIDAIKVAGNIKRFFPSEFGVEEDRITPLPPFQAFLDRKRKIRRAIEEARIPYTFVSANAFGSYFVNYLLRPHEQRNDVTVYGSGEAKAVLNYEEDIAHYTIKAANDPRTLNRLIIYRLEKNIITQLELISLWEKKTGRTFKRVHIPESDIVELTKTLPHPDNVPVAILHSLFVQADLMCYELGKDDLEASALYPDYKYTTIDQLLDIFLTNPPPPARAAF